MGTLHFLGSARRADVDGPTVTIRHGRTGSLVVTGTLVAETDHELTVRTRRGIEHVIARALVHTVTYQEQP